MTAGRVNISGSRPINGVIDDFVVSGEDISAGSFVKYVEEFKTGLGTVSGATAFPSPIRCTQIDANRAVVCYITSTPGAQAVYAMVIKFEGATIQKGMPNKIEDTNGAYVANYIVLGDNLGCIFCTTSKGIRGYVVTISDTTVTTYGGNTLSAVGRFRDAVAISSNKVALLYNTDVDTRITTVTINQYVISTIASGDNSVVDISTSVNGSIVKMSPTNFAVVAYSSTKVYCVPFKHDGITLTTQNMVLLIEKYAQSVAGVAVDKNKLIVLYTDDKLMPYACLLDTTSSPAIKLIQSPLWGVATMGFSAVQLGTRLYEVNYRRSTGANYCCRRLLHICSDYFGFGAEHVIENGAVADTNAISVGNGSFVSVVTSDGNPTARLYNYNVSVAKSKSFNEINGIAKQTGSAGQQIRVATL